MTPDSLLQTSIRIISAFFCIREFVAMTWVLLDYLLPFYFPRTHGTITDALYSFLTCVLFVLIARNAEIVSRIFTSTRQPAA
jgi:hypothetical protein